jgi:hypothetical protein
MIREHGYPIASELEEWQGDSAQVDRMDFAYSVDEPAHLPLLSELFLPNMMLECNESLFVA